MQNQKDMSKKLEIAAWETVKEDLYKINKLIASIKERELEIGEQKEFIQELTEIIDYAFEKDNFTKEYFEDIFIDDVIEKAGIRRLAHASGIRKLTDSDVKGLKFFDVFKKKPICKRGAITKAVAELLKDCLDYKLALKRIEDILTDFSGDEDIKYLGGIWQMINREKLNIILRKLNLNLTKEEVELQLINLLMGNKDFDIKRAKTLRGKTEEVLKKLIYEKLEKKNKFWVETVREKQVKDYLKLNLSKRNKEDIVGTSQNITDYLDLGMCKRIIKSEWCLFKSILIGSKEKEGFISKEDFFGSMDVVEQYGNPEIHPRDVRYKIGDRERIEIIIKKIEKCADDS